jgi:hypothetical protein
MRVGHDTRRVELAACAKWIIGNETDGVSLRALPALMQHAIDLAVLAQHVGQFDAPRGVGDVGEEVRRGMDASAGMAEMMNGARKEVAALGEAAIEAGKRKPIAEFQHKVLNAIDERRAKRTLRREKV